MSNPESFIDEVSEEVRRDKLFAAFRKYGWIGVLLVILTVGGAAYSEWRKANDRAAAQTFGDGILAALDAETPEARAAALAAVPAGDHQAALRQLMLASDPTADKAATVTALAALAADTAAPQVYRDIATLRQVIVAHGDMPLADRKAALDGIAAPGRPFRPLALEQLAYLDVEAGKTDAAIAALQALTTDQEAPGGLRQRAAQMIVALGGKVAQE